MRIKGIAWAWRDYTYRANYGGLMLVVNANNDHWKVLEGGHISRAAGESKTLDERKAAATVAAWCHVNKVKWESNGHGLWTSRFDKCVIDVAETENRWYFTAKKKRIKTDFADSFSEAQLQAIMAYEEWREGK